MSQITFHIVWKMFVIGTGTFTPPPNFVSLHIDNVPISIETEKRCEATR